MYLTMDSIMMIGLCFLCCILCCSSCCLFGKNIAANILPDNLFCALWPDNCSGGTK